MSPYYIASLEAFCRSGGFQFFEKVLAGNSKHGSCEPTPSLQTFTKVLNFVHSVRDFLEPKVVADAALSLRDICLDYARNRIDADSLRQISKADLTAFTQGVESLLNWVVPAKEAKEGVYKFTEQMELELALKCLRMPILEKKFIGHAILASKINQVRASTLPNTSGGHLSTLQSMRQRWLTKDLLVDWMDCNHLFDMLFSESTHAEVIKKS